MWDAAEGSIHLMQQLVAALNVSKTVSAMEDKMLEWREAIGEDRI